MAINVYIYVALYTQSRTTVAKTTAGSTYSRETEYLKNYLFNQAQGYHHYYFRLPVNTFLTNEFSSTGYSGGYKKPKNHIDAIL